VAFVVSPSVERKPDRRHANTALDPWRAQHDVGGSVPPTRRDRRPILPTSLQHGRDHPEGDLRVSSHGRRSNHGPSQSSLPSGRADC